MINYLKLSIALLTLLVTSACNYELSPWTTDVHCPGMSVQENKTWLKQVESSWPRQSIFSFAIVGDPQQFPADLENTIRLINEKKDVAFIVLLGDIAETGIAAEFEWACKALAKSEKPILSVIGNHDALSYGKEIWQNTFGPTEYEFTFLNTQFLAFNNNLYEFPSGPNLNWLAKTINTDTYTNQFGFSHIQPWNTQTQLSQELKQMGFDHMFHAHEHKFSYWQKASVLLPHHITADNIDTTFTIVDVNDSNLTISDCSPECQSPILRTRN